MSLHSGAPPHQEFSALPWAFGLTAVLLVASVEAADVLPLTLANAEAIALEDEPGEAAFRARADALAEEAAAAGELPDPTLRVGLANFPIESGGFSTEGMTQAQLGLRQSFPPGETRSFDAARFRSLAQEMTYSADARTRDVLTSVRSAWLEVRYWEQAHSILAESRQYFEDLVTVTTSLYAVGERDQQDVLRAELELNRLDDRMIDVERERAQARAMLAQWVGAESTRPITDRAARWERLPDLEVLQDDLKSHPVIRAADASIGAREAAVQLAEERYKPGWAVDLGYGYRDGSLPNGAPRSDFVSVSVTVDLPMFRKNRQDRKYRAALSERRAATETRSALLRRLSSELAENHRRWQELSRRIELYESRILPQSEAQANAALAAYRSEAGDFADVMRGVIDELDARLELSRLLTERDKSYAVIANLGGLSR